MNQLSAVALGLALGVACADWSEAAAAAPDAPGAGGSPAARHAQAGKRGARRPDATQQSGHVQKGTASVYANELKGRRMADGTRFDPGADVAASKTLPLGSKAQVTNLESGRTATVKVRDRGPYVPGRVIDLSQKDAAELGMKSHDLAPVAVTPAAPQ